MLIALKNLIKLIHLLIHLFFYYIYANVVDAIIVCTCMVLRHSYNDSSYFKKRRFFNGYRSDGCNLAESQA